MNDHNERGQDGPEELVEQLQVGPGLVHEPPVGVEDEEVAEEEAEEE